MDTNLILNELKESFGLESETELAKALGISTSGLANWRRRNSLNTHKLLEAFPEVNANWLLTGEGSMLVDGVPEVKTEENREEDAVQYFPDIPATGSGVENMPEPSWEDMQYTTLYIPQFGGCKAVKVSGDSMYPKLSSGDIVLFSEWNESYVQNGEMYLIITRNGERMFKYLKEIPKKEDEERIFECISANPDQVRYSPFKINGSDIVRLYRVRGRIQEL